LENRPTTKSLGTTNIIHSTILLNLRLHLMYTFSWWGKLSLSPSLGDTIMCYDGMFCCVANYLHAMCVLVCSGIYLYLLFYNDCIRAMATKKEQSCHNNTYACGVKRDMNQ
ncbi:MAG: hypothetical protein ACI8RD_006564, partial [Bacillariaceae sp.]